MTIRRVKVGIHPISQSGVESAIKRRWPEVGRKSWRLKAIQNPVLLTPNITSDFRKVLDLVKMEYDYPSAGHIGKVDSKLDEAVFIVAAGESQLRVEESISPTVYDMVRVICQICERDAFIRFIATLRGMVRRLSVHYKRPIRARGI